MIGPYTLFVARSRHTYLDTILQIPSPAVKRGNPTAVMSMFKRSFRSNDRVEKSQAVKLKKSYYRDPAKLSKLQRSFEAPPQHPRSPPTASDVGSLTSPIVTFTIGKEGRLFAAHEDVLVQSPFFAAACRSQLLAQSKRIDLPDEEPEIFSCVLEYLYVCLPFLFRSSNLVWMNANISGIV